MIERLTLKPGDSVAMVSDGELKEGTVVRVYDELDNPVAIVQFNGFTSKVSIRYLAKVQDKTEPVNEDEVEDNVEDIDFFEEITITRDELITAVGRVIGKMIFENDNPGLMVLGGLITADLCEELFAKHND